jgi:hypothetical protein
MEKIEYHVELFLVVSTNKEKNVAADFGSPPAGVAQNTGDEVDAHVARKKLVEAK